MAVDGLRIGVVIPFYQHKEGVLQRALEGICAQGEEAIAQVVVVDDGSPVPAEPEATPFRSRLPLTVHRQRNRGCSGARNAGLDLVDPAVQAVAFLDSDDVWLPGHLKRARRALTLGFDFYFEDFLFADYKEQSAFVRAGRIRPDDHELVDEECRIFRYRGDFADQILVVGNVVGTPTVVYRYDRFRTLRFDEHMINVGEDYEFWIKLARAGAKVCFSEALGCDCGTGVNVYAGVSWGDRRALQLAVRETRAWKRIGSMHARTDEQKRASERRVASLREKSVRAFLHNVRHAIFKGAGEFVLEVVTEPLAYAVAMRSVMVGRASPCAVGSD